MVSINLSRTGQRSDAKSAPIVGTVFLASIGLLAVVAAVYGGLFAYNGFIDARMAAQRTAIEEFKASLAKPEAVAVTDFSRRGEEVDKHLKAAVIPSDTLTKIEKSILPDVTLTKYGRTPDGTVTVVLSTNAIKSIAQQLLVFKANFDAVASGKIGTDKDGVFQGEVTMMDRADASVVK